MKELTQDQIIECLNDLSKRRSVGIQDTLDQLFEPLHPSGKITIAELRKREGELQELLPKWQLTWNAAQKKYGIIPSKESK